MENSDFLKYILKVSLVFFAIVFLVFAIVSFLDYSLLIGFIVGSSISYLNFVLKVLINKNFLKSKKKAFVSIFIYYIFFFALQTIFIILIIFINSYANNLKFFVERSLIVAFKPINIFTYIFGISLIMISTFIANSILYLKNRSKKIER